jgi:MFS transporter, MHS family, shikimate and dehydroshikimate transport protein
MSVVERLGGEDAGRETSIAKVGVASAIGATIEWYDFFLYGTAAGLIFNQLFFPPGNPTAGTLAAYATFAAGFVARPVGGFIFGHFGDRVGRKTMLVLTLLLMGVATFAIGLVPTYAQIGIWAPIILLTLRVFQGIGQIFPPDEGDDPSVGPDKTRYRLEERGFPAPCRPKQY